MTWVCSATQWSRQPFVATRLSACKPSPTHAWTQHSLTPTRDYETTRLFWCFDESDGNHMSTIGR
jgi:hypothetical protein